MGVTITERFNHIPQVVPTVQKQAATVINNALAQTHQVSDPLTPRDTGALAAVDYDEASPGKLVGILSWVPFYGIYQEEGTIFITGKHFARNGAEFAKPLFQSEMQAIGGKIV